MRLAVQGVWSIGLLGAVVGTLAILKEVTLVFRALKDIYQLAGYTREAGQGIATNMAAIQRLVALEEPPRRIRDAADRLASTATSVEHKLDGVGAGPSS